MSDTSPAAQWERLARLFDEAVALPLQAQAAFVVDTTTDAPELRQELADMLDVSRGGSALALERWLCVDPVPGEDARIPDAARLVGRMLGHYRVTAPLGAGGMGEVYRAIDVKLDREIALKVLPPGTAPDPGRLAQFHREARAVAALNHPNIVTLYSADDADGVHFLTMEIVEGEPLKQLMHGDGLPVERIVEVADALANALDAAHGKGIVHRDLKPANVMVMADGRVKVLDFGLAKATAPGEPADPTIAPDGTVRGVVFGTPAYMSPEQIAGGPVDHRTDFFSLGVLLYEMATGRRPFQGAGTVEVMSVILNDTPSPVADVRRELPAFLGGVIDRCLIKEPSGRFLRGREIQAALAGRAATTSSTRSDRSIAVLPFTTLSADPNDVVFADGVTEEVLNALARIPELKVAGRSSAFWFKGRPDDLQSIGAKLGVTTILAGTLRRVGDRLRITAQLVDVVSGYQVWSERYDRVLEDVFAVQDELAATISKSLELSFTAGARQASPHKTRDLRAFELYLKGRSLLYLRGIKILDAIECFNQAVVIDPAYAQAWAGLADGYTTMAYSGFKPAAILMPKALETARRALDLDPDLAEGLTALACASMLHERDDALAHRSYLRAIALNPSYTQARAWYGLFFLQWIRGREADGRQELVRMLECDPLSAYAHTVWSFSDFTSGRASDGAIRARRGLELDPTSYLGQWALTQSLLWSGALGEASTAAERALTMSGRHSWALAALVSIYDAWSRPAEARAVWRELQARAEREHVLPSVLASAAAGLGEIDLAFGLLERAVIERDPYFVLAARGWPAFDRLRGAARFDALLDRLALPR